MCWEDDGFQEEKGWVRDAINRTWEAESSLRFEGWGRCDESTRSGLRVHFLDQRGFTRGLGRQLNNVPSGVNLNTWKQEA
ncbi:uncharacterized protein SOCE26_103670 [Sorangium cellulosum]|uniref:Uncharacterized protein n=1 Tax=Sorangium cellulosum TaxID=56 RepID=A0A2L0FB49_SORCE|nr:hypothetical protein [Sorangium cellulosum]AUX48826.1 uncharacterized protein SOCE26_103670 [Sorangium cellulosum]